MESNDILHNRKTLKRIVRFLAGLGLNTTDQIRPEHIGSFMNSIAGTSVFNRRNHFSSFRGLIDWMVKNGQMNHATALAGLEPVYVPCPPRRTPAKVQDSFLNPVQIRIIGSGLVRDYDRSR